MNTIELNKDLVMRIGNYLSSKPYGEVVTLINDLAKALEDNNTKCTTETELPSTQTVQ